ncbi:MAG TPA: ribosomal-protein-alanine N-acetyltransferase, partial [Actinobacteria bacterium]|nr:ribosomal-protein-alanine N-acetyltransferase [Actinomycetes bacterium]HEX21694.1 ribosomal-protein-alanine N-acetyltransferase [Actinomycetota bacterium]
MRTDHVEKVVEIEKKSFPAPWNRSVFVNHLKHPEFAKYIVATIDNVVVGYIGLFFGGNYGQITNLAVDPAYQNQGIGIGLLTTIIRFALVKKLITISLEVRVSNSKAQELYKKMGFNFVGKRQGYYQETGEDAYVMCLQLE